jgi:hypothetical protein
MATESLNQSWPACLRLQADRNLQLSRSCMDYETAKTLELMAEQYYFEASRIEARIPELTAALSVG